MHPKTTESKDPVKDIATSKPVHKPSALSSVFKQYTQTQLTHPCTWFTKVSQRALKTSNYVQGNIQNTLYMTNVWSKILFILTLESSLNIPKCLKNLMCYGKLHASCLKDKGNVCQIPQNIYCIRIILASPATAGTWLVCSSLDCCDMNMQNTMKQIPLKS